MGRKADNLSALLKPLGWHLHLFLTHRLDSWCISIAHHPGSSWRIGEHVDTFRSTSSLYYIVITLLSIS